MAYLPAAARGVSRVAYTRGPDYVVTELHRAEVEDSKVKRWLQRECHVQSTGIWLDIDFYLAEATAPPQSRNGVSYLGTGVGFAGFLLHQRPQGIDRDFWISNEVYGSDLLTFIRGFVAIAGLLTVDV